MNNYSEVWVTFVTDRRGIAYLVFNDGSVHNWPLRAGDVGNSWMVEYYYSTHPKAARQAARLSWRMWRGEVPRSRYRNAFEADAFLS